MIARVLLGSVIAAVGFLITWKSEWFLQNFGRVNWAEQKLSGGSRIFYKLFGIMVIVIGFAIITNLVNYWLEAFAGLFI